MDVKTKAREMAQKGIDPRTIGFHFEEVIGRKLTPAEQKAVREAWRDRHAKTGEVTVEEVRSRFETSRRRV